MNNINFELVACVGGVDVFRSCDENIVYSFLDQDVEINQKRKIIDYLFSEGFIEGLYSVIL